MWEVAQALSLVKPEKLLLCLPTAEEQTKYDLFREKTRHMFPKPLPEITVPNRSLFLYFDEVWNPRLFGASSQEGNESNLPLESLGTFQLKVLNVFDELYLAMFGDRTIKKLEERQFLNPF